MEVKSFLYSKTLWTAIAYALVVSFENPINAFIKENNGAAGYIVSFIFILLRFYTVGKIKIR